MASLDIDRNGLVRRSVSKIPPKHYSLKIASFSMLKSEEKYESAEFKAGGYKWKLVLFPNGNKNRSVDHHISFYLEMGGEGAIEPGFIVTVDYKLFPLKRHKGEKAYLFLEDANKEDKKYCFYRTIVGGLAGFDRFISLEDFTDASNGYLVDDKCEFGAEVSVSKEKREFKWEYVSLTLNRDITGMLKYVWKVTDFSKINESRYYSPSFTATNQKYCSWKLALDPKGMPPTHNASHLSLYLMLYKPHKLPRGSRILAEFTLRVLDQVLSVHHLSKPLILGSTLICPCVERVMISSSHGRKMLCFLRMIVVYLKSKSLSEGLLCQEFNFCS